MDMYTNIYFSAEIDDMNICYVLRDGDIATNDIFYFSIEDNGKLLTSTLKVILCGRHTKFEMSPCFAECCVLSLKH